MRRVAPCILIMESIEAVSGVRGNDMTTEGTMDRILSTLLVELHGVETYNGLGERSKSVGVVGTTQNEKWIDPAMLRPGRLDRVVALSLSTG